jgi:hypothetical protein
LRPKLAKQLRSFCFGLAAIQASKIGTPGRGEVEGSKSDRAAWQSVRNGSAKISANPGRTDVYIWELLRSSDSQLRLLPECSIIRPTGPGQLDAKGAINGFIADGLFIGQPKEFNQLLLHLAEEADEAKREL